jgi:hypothetical protein
VHELIFTDETAARPGTSVNRIAYLGFFVAEQSGVIVEGDEFFLEGQLVGNLAGFDETHMPNHLNIVIKALSGRKTGLELGVNPGSRVNFRLQKSK